MCKSYSRTGIFGGTFDPVHFGHLIAAQEVMERFSLDRILFIPSGTPPHKPTSKVTDAVHRLNMVKLAVEGNPRFEVSAMEIERLGVTYTIDTLRSLHSDDNREMQLYFMIGADVIPELVTWREFTEVFRLCEFIASVRPGMERNNFYSEIETLSSKYSAKIHTAEIPLIEISSTQIREKVREGKSIRYLVPEKVEQYILKNDLYKEYL